MNITPSTPSVTDSPGDSTQMKLADPRVRDAEQGHKIFTKLEQDDDEAAAFRSRIDYAIDGGRPFDEVVMRDAGRGEDANVNFMEFKAEDDAAQNPFIEMTTVSRLLWWCRTGYGNAQEQATWSQIISEEHTRTVRDWGEDFDYYRIRLAQQFTRHGAGFLYWEDEYDWRFRTDGLDAFKVSRNTESRSTAISYATCKRTLSVDELYKFIRNEKAEKAAEEVGRWNVKAVKQALCRTGLGDGRNFRSDWTEFVKQMRENDLAIGATKDKVAIYHEWVREFDGSTSHYIGLQSGAVKDAGVGGSGKQIGNGWLYSNRSRFKKGRGWMIPFFYGIGTHGVLHTIRGQGELNFAPIEIGNRARCNMLDGASASTAILLQAATPNDAVNTAYIRRGPFVILSGNSKVEPTAMPDVGGRMLPVIRDMQMLRQNVTGSFQARAVTEEGTQERTKYEVQAQQQQGGTLESARLTLFFGPWSRAGKEMYDRMMNPKLSDLHPGGHEAIEFRKRCMKRGVPMKALEDVYSVEAVRSVGYGSSQVRQYSSSEIYKVSGGFDEIGRKEALRDMIASLPGVDYQTAERYVGPVDSTRPTMDDQIAELENGMFRQGQKVQRVDGQNDFVHCQHHITLVEEVTAAFDAGQIDGAQLVPILSAALDNMQQHSAALDLDGMRQKEAAYVRKFVQNQNGTLQQQENKIIAEMQRQQEEGMAAQEGQPPDAEEERKWQAHEQDIEIREREYLMRQREFEQKLALQQQKADLERAKVDLKAASEMATRRMQLNGAAA